MRFCFLASKVWIDPEAAGGDLYLGNIARGLVQRGHRVSFIASSNMISPGAKSIDGVDVHLVKRGVLYPIRLLALFLTIRRHVNMIVEEMFGGKGVPPLAALYSRKPVLSVWYQRHDKIFAEQYPRGLATLLSLMERLLARLYKKAWILTLSEKSAKELVEIGLPASRVEIVPPAGILSSHHSEKFPGFRFRENSLVFIGKIRKYKRVDHAILALAEMAASGLRPQLVIAGTVSKSDERYYRSLRSLAKEFAVDNLVHFKIYPSLIPDSEKTELLTRAKVLLQPSPVEGFSMTSVEANACGTPVVVSDGVPGDVVVPGLNGLVYPFGDIKSMANSCAKLITDEEAWETLSRNGSKMALRYNWQSTVKIFLDVVRSRLDENAPKSVGHWALNQSVSLGSSASPNSRVSATPAGSHRCQIDDRPLTSVLVINWNGRRYLEACLRSVLVNSCPRCTEIVLVDNSSTDGSIHYVRTAFPELRVVQHKNNLGFSMGYNMAVPTSRGHFLVFLNNDAIVEPGWLDPLLEPFFTQRDAGMTTSKVIFKGMHAINSTGGSLKLWTGANELGFGDNPDNRVGVREPFYANGVAMAIPRRLFEGVGGFDTKIFAYCEDVDISWRVRLAGYKILYAAESTVYHHYSASWGQLNPVRIRLMTRHYFRTMFKCLSPPNLVHATFGFAIFSLGKGAVLSLRERRVSFLQSILLAFCDTIRDLDDLRSRQKATQKLRRDSDWNVFRADGFGLFDSPRDLLKRFQVLQMLSGFPNRVANRGQHIEDGVAR